MDRTIIPNGSQPEHPAAREAFRAFCRHPRVCLVYVTGRHLALVKEALVDYDLPAPAFAITDVGSRIYRVSGEDWRAMASWESEIAPDWRGKSHAQLRQALGDIGELTLQEKEKQNRFKLSYYLPLDADRDAVMSRMRVRLADQGVNASLIWSVDEPQHIGLLDVLPKHASKLHALRFLQQHLNYAEDEMLFAGDSGNDLSVLGSGVPSVLVANASAEVRTFAHRLASRNGHPDSLYLAGETGFPLGGNYAAGVLQGIWHFHPEFRDCLDFAGHAC